MVLARLLHPRLEVLHVARVVGRHGLPVLQLRGRYSVTRLGVGKRLLDVCYTLYVRLVGSCAAAQLLTGTSYFNVNKIFPTTRHVIL